MKRMIYIIIENIQDGHIEISEIITVSCYYVLGVDFVSSDLFKSNR